MLIVGWLTYDFGPVALLALSGVSAFYFFFTVPVWCGAEGRGGSCRNNSHGALMGCHLGQHKWQYSSEVQQPQQRATSSSAPSGP